VTTFADARTGLDARSVAADARSLAAEATDALADRAAALGVVVVGVACWPGDDDDSEPPALPAFVVSAFSPMIAEVATRCLTAAWPDRADHSRPERARIESPTAIVVMSPLGDITSADHVARSVADATRIGPLMFFQAVPNAVAGLIAARWGLTGPMVSLGAADGGLDVAAALIHDGDAVDALVVLAESAPDRAVALLVTAPASRRDEQGDW
jgi:hypothetical protein